MEQEKIIYGEIMDLGFKEEIIEDNVFKRRYGYDYSVCQLRLTKRIYLDWSKETQLCELVRIDKAGVYIVRRLPILNLDHLKEIIDFFLGERT